MPLPEPSTLLLFVLTALFFAASPGLNFVFVLTRSMSHGRTEGVMSILGIGAGALLHTLAPAFTAVKTLRAIYLVYSGLKTLPSRGEPEPLPSAAKRAALALNGHRSS